ncbi:MAG: LOG family protein [Gemmataceae bacterium]|nr:LOG family protein [Gemmataceae bacterium]MDW8266751.1 LOG family protein [Gemmataceae bacterium]
MSQAGRERPGSIFQLVSEAQLSEEESPPLSVEQMVQQIKETADKLLRDGASRGDVKLLNTALKELRYAFKMFSAYRGIRKVTLFGSARLEAHHPAYQQAVAFARRIAQAGWMVVTGAAQGIMEAGHVGAGRDKSIGVNILLPFEQNANPIIQGDAKLVHLKYFFTRKLVLVKESDAVALFTGGFGTLDEGFEALTLAQTGKSHLFPIVMIDEPGGDFWRTWDDFIRRLLRDRGLISPSDLALYKVTDSVDEAVDEVLQFYRVYHSMRYVKNDLVLRLQRPLRPDLLERIRREFADIVVSGTFEQGPALPAEMSEPHLRDLPRLRFRFERRRLGRLRLLIDLINREA